MSILSVPQSEFGLQDVDWENPVNSDCNLATGLELLMIPGGIGYGSGKLYDLSGKRNHGTLTNGPTWSGKSHPGGFGSLGFSKASSQYINLGNAADFQRTDPFSVSFIARRTQAVGNEYFLSSMITTGNFPGWAVYSNPNGVSTDEGQRLAFILRTNNSVTTRIIVVAQISTLSDGLWHHYTATYDGSQSASGAKVYVDGVDRTLVVDDALGGGTMISGTHANIASRNNGSNAVSADFGPVSIHSRALSPNEVHQLYTESLRGFPSLLNRQRVWYPAAVAGGGGTTVPVFTHHYNSLRCA